MEEYNPIEHAKKIIEDNGYCYTDHGEECFMRPFMGIDSCAGCKVTGRKDRAKTYLKINCNPLARAKKRQRNVNLSILRQIRRGKVRR